jgi:membrane fusion protein (multidrug efflux system)
MLKMWIQNKNFKKITVGIFIIFSVIGWFSLWLHNLYYISTDNAYVNAHVVQIAPRISGQVANLFVKNNQYVTQGQLLFTIDQELYQVALEKAQAELAIQQSKLHYAELTSTRTSVLVKKKFLSPQAGDNTKTSVETADAAVQLAKTNFKRAALNMKYTQITAPATGWITNLSVRSGSLVTANQPLFALVSSEEFWVDANFKETEIEKIKSGQRASIIVDMYPGHVFTGPVESLSEGTGSVFSLLPPQNATGNWVKVTQRIPIRIRITNPDAQFPLRIGSSAKVTIHLR